MTSVYNLLRETCGLSQQEAADFHEARLDSVKSWCSDRRPAPPGVIDELRELAREIISAGEEFAAQLKRTSKGNELSSACRAMTRTRVRAASLR